MWQQIDEVEYMERVVGLKPIESFSDPDGVFSFGYGRPAMDTVWGTDGEPILKREMRKENRHQLKWDNQYFKFV